MKSTKLSVEKRTTFGEKVKNLRKAGIVPATIYGKAVESVSIQVPLKEFEKVYKEAGETGLVELTLGSEKPRHTLIKNVQLEPRESVVLHVDFYQVNLSEKIKAMVPVEAIGEPKAVLDKVGVLLTPLAEVEVESLPTDLPEKIEVNVEHLAVVDDAVKVADIKIPTGVAILTDPEQILFKVGSLITKEAEAEAKAEEAAAAATEAAAEGATPAEGEAAPAEGEKPEEKKEAPPAEEKKE